MDFKTYSITLEGLTACIQELLKLNIQYSSSRELMKQLKEKQIYPVRDFPMAFEGFHNVMQQANAAAILPLTEGRNYFTPDSINNLGRAVDKWYNRF